MLVAISGSQGTGKSTILKDLSQRGYNVVGRKTSRSILSDWGVTLSQVNNDRELTTRFQDEISKRKFNDELEGMNSPDIWFTERTHSDLFTYALIAIGKDNEYSEWVDAYYKKCEYYNSISYKKVFYLDKIFDTVENDGVRGVNSYYSEMVDIIMKRHTLGMFEETTVIRTTDHEERIKIILEGLIPQL